MLATFDRFILFLAGLYLRFNNRRLVRQYRSYNGRLPNIGLPGCYSEWMLWRKLVDRNPDFVMFSDKLECKEYLRRICPELPVPATLWVGTDTRAIPDELLQRNVFIKANHGCGFNFNTRGQPVDRAALEQKAARWLQTDFGRETGEWPYRQVTRKILVEESIAIPGAELVEFNIRASNGLAILGSVMFQVKTPGQWHFYLDPQGQPTWDLMALAGSAIPTEPPDQKLREPYLRAVALAERLSRGTDYARYDFFWNGQTLFGGEITLFPACGFIDPRHPHHFENARQKWNIFQAHFFRVPHRGLKRIYAAVLRRRVSAIRAVKTNIT